MNKTIPCTVAILTRNSAATLGRALESVKDFREIIVCDGGSTDATLDIAQRYGARVIAQDSRFLDVDGRIADFAAIRNQTLDAAREAWFFFLDSDEYISSELADEIRLVTTADSDGAWNVSRRYMIGGREVTCATTYPNLSLRLFARSSAGRFLKKVHERIELRCTPKTLSGKFFVPVGGTLGPSSTKMAYYINLQIEQSKSNPLPFGKKFSYVVRHHILVSALYAVRLLKIMLLCRGVKMPLHIELDRHRYNARLIMTMWRRRKEFPN